jgi:hypothetical protein
VTFTIQVHDAEVWTTSVCDPRPDCAVTDCPVPPVSLIAGVPEGLEPAGTTKTWNDGPAAGAGAQANAQPMFHGAAVVVKAVLVQLPFICGELSNTRAGPAAAVDDVVGVVDDPPAAVVVVEPPDAVVVVPPELPPAAVVVVAVLPAAGPAAEAGGGKVPEVVPPVLDVPLPPPPVSPLIHMPRTTASRIAIRSCQVFHERRSLILRSPG